MHAPPLMDERRRAMLARLIDPASIAIVGVSPRAGSFGLRTVENLAKYTGDLYLVNPRYETIGDRTCHPSLRALPAVPDCVVIAVGRELVEDVVRECAELGVGAVIVYASGYAEGDDPLDPEAQQRLKTICQRTGMGLVGPNCLGLVNFCAGMGATFNAGIEIPEPQYPAIGLVSQSGALGFALAQAGGNGLSFSHLLTSGNSADIDICDYIAYLAHDPRCQSIACVFEGLAQPLRLVEAALLARRAGKPLVIYKLATGEQGAAAAMSHTGSLAGSNEVYRAALAGTGAVLVDHWEALLETAAFFAKAPAPRASGCAVIATSGGATIMAADCAERHGVPLLQPHAHTRAELRRHLPDFASVRNPCDVTAQILTDPESMRGCARALLQDDQFGSLMVVQTRANAGATARAHLFAAQAADAGKPLCIVWLTGWIDGPPGSREIEMSPGISLFRSMDRCCFALAAWQRWWAWQDPASALGGRLSSPDAAQAAVQRIRANADDVLTERAAKDVLSLYGVPVVSERLATSEDEAATLANATGYPVVLKVESPDLAHKTEAGVVALRIADETALRVAYRHVMGNAQRVSPAPRILGVLVQPMVEGGVELIVGGRIDPLFGPLIAVGLGGVFVEVLQDLRMTPAPIGREAARALIDGLKGRRLLAGFRNAEPVDIDGLADTVARLSEFISDMRDDVVEFDVNPLICKGAQRIAVDALIVRSTGEKRHVGMEQAAPQAPIVTQESIP